MKLQRTLVLLGIVCLLNCAANTLAGPFYLPLRFESAGTCLGNGSTTQTIETNYGSSLAGMSFTGTASYNFYSPPITAAPSLAATDKAGGLLWLTNASPTTDFHVTVGFIFYDFDPATLTDTLIVDTGPSSSTAIKHLQAEKVVPPNASLPAGFTATVGHLLHIKATVTLVSGTVSSASILFNAASGAKGDSVGMLPQNPTAKFWAFGGLAGPPDATITPSSSCISANCTNNTASAPSTAGAAYAWTVTGGTITAGQGTHQIAWRPSSTGPVTLGVTVTRACSSVGSALIAVMPGNILSLKPNAAGSMTLTLAGSPSAQYRFQAASSLSSPAWVTISTNIAGTDGLATFIDQDAPNYPVRFYRATTP